MNCKKSRIGGLIAWAIDTDFWRSRMSNILKFPLERVQRKSFGMYDVDHNAEVLVFEGVQYEKGTLSAGIQKNKKNPVNQAKSKL